MNKLITLLTIVVLCTTDAALAGPKDDAIAAAKKLVDSDNYSWTTEAVGAAGGAGGSEGKTQKDGLTMLKLGLRGQMTQVFFQGERGAYQGADGAWHSIADAAHADVDQSAQMIANMVKTYLPPGGQALHVANQLLDAQQQADGTITGKLSADDAKALMERRMVRRAGAGQITDPSASIKFTLNDGSLAKIEFHMQGKVTAQGQEQQIDRTTVVTIKDVGTTKIEIPADAKAKMN